MLRKPGFVRGSMKTVTFSDDTVEPLSTLQCACCYHRNIKPKLRDYKNCSECKKRICSMCITTMDICKYCKEDLFVLDGYSDFDDVVIHFEKLSTIF
jgi:hypothetical protein